MADKYDEAIAFLVANPHMIRRAWFEPDPDDDPEDLINAHSLFEYASRSGGPYHDRCGCLTQIRGSERFNALRLDGHADETLTAAIRADERIPAGSEMGEAPELLVEHLPVFAEWQRRLDKELGR